MAKPNPWKSKEYIGMVPKLIECMPATEVRGKARAEGMITPPQAERIASHRVSSDQNRELLNELEKGNAKSFEKFIAILYDTDVVSIYNAIHEEAVPKLKSVIANAAPPQQHGSSASNGSNGVSASATPTAAQVSGAGSPNAELRKLKDVAKLQQLANNIEDYLGGQEKSHFARLVVETVDRDLVNNTSTIMTTEMERNKECFKHVSSPSAPFVVLSWLKGKQGDVTMQTVLNLLVGAASAKKETFTRMFNDSSLYL